MTTFAIFFAGAVTGAVVGVLSMGILFMVRENRRQREIFEGERKG